MPAPGLRPESLLEPIPCPVNHLYAVMYILSISINIIEGARRYSQARMRRRLVCAANQTCLEAIALLRELGSASDGGLEPPDDSAPGSDFSAAHGRLQPHDQFVPGNGPAARAIYSELRRADRRNFRRRKPVGARTTQSSLCDDAGRRALRDRARHRKL